MRQTDLLLLHPPSVYDFRKMAIMYGPISDLIPSSPVFEMYPLGFLTLTNYLEARGFKVRIVNLALKMMNSRRFDVPAYLARLRPGVVGIDLHWLPHAHGALEVARLIRDIHPEIPIVMGGLSSTYYHQELILRDEVDYVLRGDSVEEPMEILLTSLRSGSKPEAVPNLTWKDGDQIRVNPFSFAPETLDYVDLSPDTMMKMVLRYRDLSGILPFNRWWKNPITAVFTAKGCSHECVTCGNSRHSCSLLSKRQRPIFRSPENLVKNMLDISRFSKGPIFLVGDLCQNGEEYANQTLKILSDTPIKNEVVFELFGMPSPEYLKKIDDSVRNWSLELSPESHDESIRKKQNPATFFTNTEMENIIRTTLGLRCTRIDVFFMIGLPLQTKASVADSMDYCERLFQMSDKRLSCFVSPMGPFLDPGSRCFENPDQYGYRLFARTLEEHRNLLVQPSWKTMLNYETRWMNRDELVEATYDAAERLNTLKLQYGRIKKSRGHSVASRIQKARSLNKQLESIYSSPSPDPAALMGLQGDIYAYSVSTVCDKRELFWKRHIVNFKIGKILHVGLAILLESIQSAIAGRVKHRRGKNKKLYRLARDSTA